MANQFDPNPVSNFPNCPNGLLSFNQFEIMNNTNIQWDIFKRYQQNSNQFFTYNAFNNKLDIINSRPIIDLKTWMIDLPDIDIYIGDLFNYTTWLISDTDFSNFSANFAFITSILASLCGRIRIKMGEWIEPANLHTFIIAESGYRKSVLIDRATNIFLEYEDKYNQNYDQNESRFKKI